MMGAGSSSFEIMRYLVERLPVMITPRWVSIKNQPIAIRNVLGYLKGCLEKEETIGQTFDIGGPDILTYRRLFETYAEEAGLRKRLVLPVPFFTPGLSSYWIHLVTPAPAMIARPLAEGLRNEVVCQDNRIRGIIPQDLLDCRETIRLALMRSESRDVETCWSDAACRVPPEWIICGDAPYAGGTVMECGVRVRLKAKPEEVWNIITRIGGRTGWYFGDALWRLWGLINKLAGGAGIDRGRINAKRLRVGDAVDFWRVLDVAPLRLLRLWGEMKTPGEAILEFRLGVVNQDVTDLDIIPRFHPKGLLGIAYWCAMLPIHVWFFNGMARGIAKASGSEIIKGPDRLTSGLHRKRVCK